MAENLTKEEAAEFATWTPKVCFDESRALLDKLVVSLTKEKGEQFLPQVARLRGEITNAVNVYESARANELAEKERRKKSLEKATAVEEERLKAFKAEKAKEPAKPAPKPFEPVKPAPSVRDPR